MFTTGTRVESQLLRCHGHQRLVVANTLMMRCLSLSRKISPGFQVADIAMVEGPRDWENKYWIVLEYTMMGCRLD